MTRIRERTLSELKRAAWENAVRLFRDACTLFQAGGYPSSYALAVLAFEEAGRVYALDHMYDDIVLNPGIEDEVLPRYVLGGMTKSHRWKQEWAFVEALFRSRDSHAAVAVRAGQLDRSRQEALYVDLDGGKVRTPSRIEQPKAMAMLKDVLTTLEAGGDIAYIGFYGESTAKSEWQAQVQLDVAREALASCERAACKARGGNRAL